MTRERSHDDDMETLLKKPEIAREALEAAVANAALEGLRPDEDTMADLELLAAGKLTGEEYRSRLHARYGGV